MGRPCITGSSKRRKQYKRVAVAYGDKRDVLKFLNKGNSIKATILHFYGQLTRKDHRAKEKQISKWKKASASIQSACASGRARHLNSRKLGDGTVLSLEAEEEIVRWINTFMKEGIPVSRFMLKTKAMEVAKESDIAPDKFSASSTWMKLFMRRHRLSLRTRTRQGQTTPQDAAEAAQAFRALVLQTAVEQNCTKVFNADQTAVFFEHVPKKTILAKDTKTVWIKCTNKDKHRATVMLLADSDGVKCDPFIIFKTSDAKTEARRAENGEIRNGFGTTIWREVKTLQKTFPCRIFGNKTAWWNADLSLNFLEVYFANRENPDDKVLLLWDDFSSHWTKEVKDYAVSLNVVLLKVPPKYTYVCQPADISWNKPFKGLLRSIWIETLRDQLRKYNSAEKARQQKRSKLAADILSTRKQYDQQEADRRVAILRDEFKEKPFALVGPSRRDITKWIMSSWDGLSRETIVSGFSRAGLLMDTRPPAIDACAEVDTDAVIASLQKHNLAEGEMDSDDDIGSDSGSSEGDDSSDDDTGSGSHSSDSDNVEDE